MNPTLFRVTSRLAYIGAVVAGLAAAALLVSGALALTGKTSLPAEHSVGPFTFSHQVTVPVQISNTPDEICQSSDISDPDPTCINWFLHGDDVDESSSIRRQPDELRPLIVQEQFGTVLLATDGWSSYLAGQVAIGALIAVVVASILFQLARLLGAVGRREVFTTHSVRRIRWIGLLIVLLGFVDWVLTGMLGFGSVSVSIIGDGVHLSPQPDNHLHPLPILAGGLILLIAEVFRHGVNLEDEAKLTV